MPPHRELNDRFKGYQRKARGGRIVATSIFCVCMLVGVGLAFELAVPPNSIARTQLTKSLATLRASLPNFTPVTPRNNHQIASAAAALSGTLEDATSQLAAAASSGYAWLDRAAGTVYDLVCPLFRSCPVAINPSENANSQHATSLPNVKPAIPLPPPQGRATATTSPRVVSTVPASGTHPTTVINNPVIERTKETVRTIVEGGVNTAYVDERMQALAQSLQSQISSVAAASHSESQTIYQTVGMVARVEELTDTKLHSPDIDGGTITGATITGGSVTASAFSGTLGIGSGGTGTSSTPTYGQLLLGDSNGGYSLVATSSLGITSSSLGALSSYDAWTHPAAGQSATTSLLLFNGAASSTLFSVTGPAYFGATATSTFTTAGWLGIGTTSPGISTSAGRSYLTIQGSSGSGVLELTSAASDADNVLNGIIQFTDANSLGRLALITARSARGFPPETRDAPRIQFPCASHPKSVCSASRIRALPDRLPVESVAPPPRLANQIHRRVILPARRRLRSTRKARCCNECA